MRAYAEHACGLGAKYTRSHPPVRLLVVEPHSDRSSALKAEYAFKQLPAAEKRRRTGVKEAALLASALESPGIKT
jgi:putative endonuclease